MEQHVKIPGVLHIVFGSQGILLALGILALFGGIAGLIGANGYLSDTHISIPIVGGIGAFIFFVLPVLSLPGLVAGIGLPQFRSWARIPTIVSVLDARLGTALPDHPDARLTAYPRTCDTGIV